MNLNTNPTFEIPTDSFESLLTILDQISQDVATISENIKLAFNSGQLSEFGNGLNTTLGVLSSIVSVIATFIGSDALIKGIGIAFATVGDAAGSMVSAIAGAISLTAPEIAILVAAIVAIVATIAICWEEIQGIFQQIGEWINTSFLAPISESFGKTIDWVWKGYLQPLWERLKSFAASLKEMVKTIWDNFLGPLVEWIIGIVGPKFSSLIGLIGDVVGTVVAIIADLFSGIVEFLEGIINFITGVFSLDAQKAFDGIWKMLEGVITFFGGLLKGMCNLLVDGLNLLINAVYQVFRVVANAIGGLVDFVGSLFGQDWGWSLPDTPPKIPKLATGGFPSTGEMFIAREAGPELVGTIGSRTAVVNNEQIVESVSRGVYDAVRAALSGRRGSADTPLEVKLYLDGRQITSAVERVQKERGLSLLSGSAVYSV